MNLPPLWAGQYRALGLRTDNSNEFRQEAISALLKSVQIRSNQIVLTLNDMAAERICRSEIVIPWSPSPRRPKRKTLLLHIDPARDPRPIRIEVKTHIIRAAAIGRLWLTQVISGEVADMQVLAEREGRSKRSVQMMISLAFIAPDIVEPLIEGTLPRGIGITRLCNLPSSWNAQRKVLGLAIHRSN